MFFCDWNFDLLMIFLWWGKCQIFLFLLRILRIQLIQYMYLFCYFLKLSFKLQLIWCFVGLFSVCHTTLNLYFIPFLFVFCFVCFFRVFFGGVGVGLGGVFVTSLFTILMKAPPTPQKNKLANDKHLEY